MRQHGPRYPWLDVAPVLRRADVTVANLETAVSNRGHAWPGKEYTFRGPPKALRATARFAGVDVVSLANNHSLDYGRVAFADTLRFDPELRPHEDGRRPRPGRRAPARSRRARRAQRRLPRLLRRPAARIRRRARPLGRHARVSASDRGWTCGSAQRQHDLVVVYFHWGIESDGSPSGASALAGRPGASEAAQTSCSARTRTSSSRASGEARGTEARRLEPRKLRLHRYVGVDAHDRNPHA